MSDDDYEDERGGGRRGDYNRFVDDEEDKAYIAEIVEEKAEGKEVEMTTLNFKKGKPKVPSMTSKLGSKLKKAG